MAINEMEKSNLGLVELGTARRTLFPLKRGREISPATLWRWINKGVCGVRLETVYVGSTPYVTAEMTNEFFRKVTLAKNAQREAKLAAAADVTDEELAAAGLSF